MPRTLIIEEKYWFLIKLLLKWLFTLGVKNTFLHVQHYPWKKNMPYLNIIYILSTIYNYTHGGNLHLNNHFYSTVFINVYTSHELLIYNFVHITWTTIWAKLWTLPLDIMIVRMWWSGWFYPAPSRLRGWCLFHCSRSTSASWLPLAGRHEEFPLWHQCTRAVYPTSSSATGKKKYRSSV